MKETSLSRESVFFFFNLCNIAECNKCGITFIRNITSYCSVYYPFVKLILITMKRIKQIQFRAWKSQEAMEAPKEDYLLLLTTQ